MGLDLDGARRAAGLADVLVLVAFGKDEEKAFADGHRLAALRAVEEARLERFIRLGLARPARGTTEHGRNLPRPAGHGNRTRGRSRVLARPRPSVVGGRAVRPREIMSRASAAVIVALAAACAREAPLVSRPPGGSRPGPGRNGPGLAAPPAPPPHGLRDRAAPGRRGAAIGPP